MKDPVAQENDPIVKEQVAALLALLLHGTQ